MSSGRGATHGVRDRREAWLRLAEHLPAGDRLLLQQLYDHGLTVQDLARLTQTCPRKLERRAHRLIQRIEHPGYAYTLLHSQTLGEDRLRVARRLFLEGQTLRQITRETHLSMHAVRQHAGALRTLASEAERARTAVRGVRGPGTGDRV